jgi:hypothetical protein
LFELDLSENLDDFDDILSICDVNLNDMDNSPIPGLISIWKTLENHKLISLTIGQDLVWTASVCWNLPASMKDADIGFLCQNFDFSDHLSLPTKIHIYSDMEPTGIPCYR